ncbi:MAG: hypothetical protein J7J01_01175 [Methanophagales archaeon]|nr:hypothetical protein [Methanophagales archaeon]
MREESNEVADVELRTLRRRYQMASTMLERARREAVIFARIAAILREHNYEALAEFCDKKEAECERKIKELKEKVERYGRELKARGVLQ